MAMTPNDVLENWDVTFDRLASQTIGQIMRTDRDGVDVAVRAYCENLLPTVMLNEPRNGATEAGRARVFRACIDVLEACYERLQELRKEERCSSGTQ